MVLCEQYEKERKLLLEKIARIDEVLEKQEAILDKYIELLLKGNEGNL